MTFDLIDVRNQYTIHLKKILIDHIWDGINSLYLKSRELKGPWMVTFQTFLKDIKNWNTEQIKKAASDVETNVNHKSPNFLKELLTTIIVLNVKVLSSACSTESEHIEINIPTTSEFIYDLYIGVAKKVYNNPSLYDHNVNIKTLTTNIDVVYKMIADTVEEVISSFLPYESLITQYLEYMNNEDRAPKENNPDEDSQSVKDEFVSDGSVKEESVKEESDKESVKMEESESDDTDKRKTIVIKHRENQKTKTSLFSDADSDSE